VDFDDLDERKFAYIRGKLANAGIIIHLDITQNTDPQPTSINSAEIENGEDNCPLESYIFRITRKYSTYNIRFSLRRVI
jgi:hypothetical protein